MERLLIVDDNTKNVQVLATILANNNYKVEYALRGQDAIELLKSEDFALILLDIMMPEMDGFETCMEIKKLKGKENVPIIFLTAKTDIDSITKGFEMGGVDYITKPFNEKELLKRIQTHLELTKSREKLKQVNQWLEKKIEERILESNTTKENLEKTNKELIRVDKAKTSFLSAISNEIGKPMEEVSSFFSLLKKQSEIGEHEKYFNLLSKSVQKLQVFSTKALIYTELISMILLERDLKTLNLKNLVLSTINNLNLKINQKHVVIDTANLSDEINIKGNEDLLHKCFEYVIENAIDFSYEKGEIKISAFKYKNNTTFEIIDYGKGFPPELVQNVYGLVPPDNQTGENTGLSLAIVMKIMEKHGGLFTFKNMEKGSKVCLHFKK